MSINENNHKVSTDLISIPNQIPVQEKLNLSNLSKSSDKNIEFNNKIEFANNDEPEHIEKICLKEISKKEEEFTYKIEEFNFQSVKKINQFILDEKENKEDDNNINQPVSHNNLENNLVDIKEETKEPINRSIEIELKIKKIKEDTEKTLMIELTKLKENLNNDDDIAKKINSPKKILFDRKKTLLAKDLNDYKNEEKVNELQIFKNESKEEKKENDIQKKVPISNVKVNYIITQAFFKKILDHFITTIIFSLFTIYALFADDVKMLTCDIVIILFNQTYDTKFSIVIIILIFCFTVELIISCLFQDKYFLNFFFFLDFLSLLSMFLDIHWVYNSLIDPLANTYPTQAELDAWYSGGVTNGTKSSSIDASKGQRSQAKGAASLARATRGARVGSRAVRILRILRLIR